VLSAGRSVRHPPDIGSEPDRPAAEQVERNSPGVAALFEGVSADRSHAILDLGPAAGASLSVYSRFARWVGFADVLTAATSSDGAQEALHALPPNPERPYDLVVAWDVLDRLPPGGRASFMQRLTELTAPRAKMFLMLELPDERRLDLLRFTITEVDRLSYQPTREFRPGHPPVPPGELKRLLEPFEVARAFSTRLGLREYVAVRHG
jgi:hypothetical protein